MEDEFLEKFLDMKKTAKILGKLILGLIGLLLILSIILKLSFNEDIPQGISGPAADKIAFKVLKAIHHKEFTQASEIHWKFADHIYEWKLQQGAVDVYWDDYKVNLVTAYPQISYAWKDGKKLTDKAFQEAIDHALFKFNNDSFWIIAPHKIFDPGVKRQLIEIDRKQQLLVTYSSGGSTPGDSYLWELNDKGLPIAFKMWVNIIPLDGVRATWTDWEMTDGGFPLPKKRSLYGIDIPISEVNVIK